MNALPALPLSEEVRGMLERYSWRGNVRVLENTMHRAVLLARGTEISTEAIMLAPSRPAAEGAAESSVNGRLGLVGRTVADVERDLILETLQHCLGNRTHAANILGISIRTLRNKLQQYRQEGVAIPVPGEPERAAV